MPRPEDQLTVKIADTPEKQRKGFMYKKQIDDNESILFLYTKDSPRSFHMKNVSVPLSIAFMNREGKLRKIEDMEPDTGKSSGPCMYAIEGKKGLFDRLGLKEGDTVDIQKLTDKQQKSAEDPIKKAAKELISDNTDGSSYDDEVKMTVKGNRSAIESAAELLENVETRGAPGHSFEIGEIGPSGSKEGGILGSYDGDGPDRIDSIILEDQESEDESSVKKAAQELLKMSQEQNKKYIAVDLDGCLAQCSGVDKASEIGPPVLVMKKRVQKALDNGKNIKILTPRVAPGRGSKTAQKAIKQWTRKHFGQEIPATYKKTRDIQEFWGDGNIQVDHNSGHKQRQETRTQLEKAAQELLKLSQDDGVTYQTPIDMHRPPVKLPDGNYGTERTITLRDKDGNYHAVPSIQKGDVLDPDQAAENFRQGKVDPVITGNSQESVNRAAEIRSREIGRRRSGELDKLHQGKWSGPTDNIWRNMTRK